VKIMFWKSELVLYLSRSSFRLRDTFIIFIYSISGSDQWTRVTPVVLWLAYKFSIHRVLGSIPITAINIVKKTSKNIFQYNDNQSPEGRNRINSQRCQVY